MDADMTSRCAIYARVSTKEQVSNLSLETQREACTAYARTNGWLVDRVFVEEGESAKTADRPELQRLIEYCRSHRDRIQFVVVYNLSRFSRKTEDHLVLRALLAGIGVQLRSVTEPISEQSSGRLIETVMSAFWQFDNDARSERTVAGMQAALMRGRWPYVAPLGYRNTRDAAGIPTIEQDPTMAPLIREAFEQAALGLPQREILRFLRERGCVTKKGRAITSKTLAGILRSPVYAGILRVPVWRIEATAAFLPIVDVDLFRAVQAALGARKTAIEARLQINPDFPLRGFVRCCRPLVGYWAQGRSGRYPYYACQPCRTIVRRDALEDAFVSLLDELRPDPETMQAFKREILDEYAAARETASAQAENLRRRANALQERKERLAEAYALERAMDSRTYAGLMDKLDREQAETETALAEAQHERLDAVRLVNGGLFAITHAGNLWRGATAEQRLALQDFLLPAGLAWKKASGFRRTAVRGFEFNEMPEEMPKKAGVVDHGSADANRWLLAARRLLAILPMAA